MSAPVRNDGRAERELRQTDMAIARVESLNHEGQGVAHIDGKAVFIHGALPGEEVRFRYHNKRKTFDTGIAVDILRPSPDRVVQPPCPHFGVCGGCTLQHLAPAAQIRAKQQILLDNLVRIGKTPPAEVLPPLTGPAWGYRRKARLGVRLVPKKGGVLIGFREKRSSFITPLTHCETLDSRVANLLPALRELVSGLSCADRLPQIEVAAGDNALALVFRHLEPLIDTDRDALRAFARARDVQVLVQPAGPDSIQPLEPPQSVPLHYALPEGIDLEFGPTDFVQVNPALNRAMIERALALLAPTRSDRVLDLFCGLGNFTLPLAQRAGQVTGVEVDAALLMRAQGNAQRNGLHNIDWRAANLYDEAALDTLPWREPYTAWLLDPPRTGALEVIKRVPIDGPRRILYVSCFPATLARDAEVLVHVKGYRLAAAGVMDMFPQTTHVESLALFEKTQ